MGAVPGGRVLTSGATLGPSGPAPPPFDVDAFRPLGRTLVRRRHAHPAVVLGSSQREELVDRAKAQALGLEVVRRRSGGGAVLVQPGDPVWFDVWVPRGDPLFDDDVVAAAGWVGRWWSTALAACGARPTVVHDGPSTANEWSATVCFAGLGPGEVTASGRKVVGVAQWRGREGSLFHTAAHRVWDPVALTDLLHLPDEARRRAGSDLAQAGLGLEDLLGSGLDALGAALSSLLPGTGWDHLTD
ncbi:MAG TPA: hypothetical protein VK277_01190 [Acidimicrobiales bacterium]|nr:hypothetical protein [Acidimicrobiales bacterium]